MTRDEASHERLISYIKTPIIAYLKGYLSDPKELEDWVDFGTS